MLQNGNMQYFFLARCICSSTFMLTSVIALVFTCFRNDISLIITSGKCFLFTSKYFAEVRRLASYSKIGEMQQMIVDALMDIAQRTHPENPRHVPSLILLLTHIRQAGERGIAYFQSLKREGCVTFCDLLTEMLDAHNSAAAAAASAAATTSAVTATVTMPSTSSVGVDQKNISPQQHAMGGTLITKRGSQEDNMNPYV